MFLLTSLFVGQTFAGVTTNEFQSSIIMTEIMQSNFGGVIDYYNEFPDSWVEVYNSGNNSSLLFWDGNMDNFVLIQNYLTLENLYARLSRLQTSGTPYQRLNLYTREFIDFVIENKNLWFLVHNFHLMNNNRRFSKIYLKRVVQITKLVENAFKNMFPELETPECIYIDDYAHHPEEIKACLRAAREIYQKRKMTLVFH